LDSIGPGTYNETVTVNVQGTAKDGPITFTSLIPTNPAVMSGKGAKVQAPDGSLTLIYLENKSYLRFVNLVLTGLTSPDCSGVRIIGGGTNVGEYS